MLSALSGGVDSAVATALLVEAGYEVIAISMLLAGSAEGHAGSCCSIDDFQDARRVAEQLGIPYYVLNLKDAFQTRVIDVFTREYQRGRTPNPCLLCNRDLKFDVLWQRARELDAELSQPVITHRSSGMTRRRKPNSYVGSIRIKTSHISYLL